MQISNPLLRNRNFIIFILSQFLSLIGERVSTIAFISLISNLDKTNSDKNVTLVGFFQFLPILIFSFFGGVLTDKFNKKSYLLVINLIRVITYFAFYLLINFNESIFVSFATLIILGTFTALFNPAKKSFIPHLIGVKENNILQSANWLFLFTEIAAMFVGIALGSYLLNFVLPISLILIDILFFIISIALINLIVLAKINTNHIEEPKLKLSETVKKIQNKKELKFVFFYIIIPFNCSAAFFYSATSFWSARLNPANAGQPLGYAFLLIASGSLIGYFLRNFYAYTKPLNVQNIVETRFTSIVLFIAGLSILCLYLLPLSFNMLTIFLFIICGIMIGIMYIMTIYLIQLYTDLIFIGRVFGISELIFGLSFCIIISIVVSFKEFFNYHLLWSISGLILMLSSFLMRFYFDRKQAEEK